MPRAKRKMDDTPSAKKRARSNQFPPTLPLIEYTKSTKQYRIPEETLTFLESLGDRKLAIIAVTGPYRSGKSFLQNNVILKVPGEQGFAVGDTINACTKGLHLSTTILDASSASDGDYGVIVVDTEGLNDVHASETEDARIMSLAMLLSSLLVYNCKNTIDQNALSNLNMVANISKHIQVTASKQTRKRTSTAAEINANEVSLSQYFPPLMWVVRDFCLDLVDANGKPIDQSEYLELALAPIEGVEPEKNKIRESIRRFFPYRDCVTMVRPCADEGDTKRLSTMDEADMRPEFVAQSKEFRKKIMSTAQPKKMCGTYMTGSLLATFAGSLCDAFNDNKAPAIQDQWSLISMNECSQSGARALEIFDKHLSDNNITSDTDEPFRPEKLEEVLLEGFRLAKDAYNQKAIGDQAEPVLQKLSDTLRVRANAVRRHNRVVVAGLASDAVSELDSSLMDYSEFSEFLEDMKSRKKEFTSKWGEDKQPAFDAELVSRFKGWVVQFHAKLYETEAVARQTAEMLSNQAESSKRDLARAEKELATSKSMLAELEEQVEEHMGTISDMLRKQTVLQEEVITATQANEDTEERHRTTMQGIQAQVTSLQSECSTRQTALLQATTDLNDLQGSEAELRANLDDRNHELETLRTATADYDQIQAQIPQLEQQIQFKQDSIDDLNDRLDSEAEEHRMSLNKLQEQSRETIATLRTSTSEMKSKLKKAEARTKSDVQMIRDAKTKAEGAEAKLSQALKEKERLAGELANSASDLTALVADHKARMTALRTEDASRARETQEKMEAMNRQFQADMKAQHKKAQVEYDELFTQNMTANRELQDHKARADQHQMLLTQVKEQLAKERQRSKDGNYVQRITELEKQLASENMRAEMLTKEKARLGNQASENQSRIRELEANLRTVDQRHRAELTSLELEYEKQLSQQA